MLLILHSIIDHAYRGLLEKLIDLIFNSRRQPLDNA